MEEILQLKDLTDKRIRLSNSYAKERKLYGETKAELDIIYASKIIKLQEKKRNLGYETGLLMMLAESSREEREMLTKMYTDMIKAFNNYKAIERMIDAIECKIISIEAGMRYNRTNDGHN